MGTADADMDRHISAKRNEWIEARTAELGGRGSAENTRRLNEELKALEAQKAQQESKEMTHEDSDRGKDREHKGNKMVRKMKLKRGR
jgi:hypothetical protein